MDLLFPEILDIFEKAKTRADKVLVLKKHEVPALRGVLRINFDKNIKMDLPEGEPPFRKELDRPAGYQETNLVREYRRFYIWLDPKQNLPRIRKEKLFIEMLEGLHHSEAQLLCMAKDRQLQTKWKSLKEDIVREAYPNLLPPIEEVKKEAKVPLQ